MTKEILMKANELNQKINYMTERLEKCSFANGSCFKRNDGCYGDLPITADLKRIINVLVTDNIKAQLMALTAEMENI